MRGVNISFVVARRAGVAWVFYVERTREGEETSSAGTSFEASGVETKNAFHHIQTYRLAY